MTEKKRWHKPAFIVLVRRKSEEAVLQTCKHTLITGPLVVGCIVDINLCHDTLPS